MRLEERLAIEQRVRHRHAYVELLRRFHAFYVPVESRLLAFAAAFREHGIDLRPRLKAATLQRDLIALGAGIGTTPHRVPDISTFAHAVGCLYVLEGSTLGGQLIMRHVRKSLGLDADTGAGFYAGYGEHTGSMWQAFLVFLSAVTFDAQQTQQAINAARETFITLELWLCEPATIAAASHPIEID